MNVFIDYEMLYFFKASLCRGTYEQGQGGGQRPPPALLPLFVTGKLVSLGDLYGRYYAAIKGGRVGRVRSDANANADADTYEKGEARGGGNLV